MPPEVAEYLRSHESRFLSELRQLLRIPSVSGDPAYQPAMRQAAEWLTEHGQQIGLQTNLVTTPGHPIVTAAWRGCPGGPTVLVYGHYDVQPPDPLDRWTSPPFEPTIRDGKVFARGATDDKGQFFTHLKSVEAWLRTTGKLPVNVVFVIEGEEEVGSRHLDDFLSRELARLACDVAVISDTSQYAPGLPAITYGLRGILACEVTVQGPSHDLHSGIFGGAIANPTNGLARMIAALHDDHGAVAIPGFYDDVVPLTADERRQFAALPFDESQFLRDTGAIAAAGEPGWTILERRWARPTCDVNGLFGGHTGAGPKTIIPAQATAKITCRLVPNQHPEQLSQALEAYLRERCPAGLTMTFAGQHGCPAFVFEPTSGWVQAACRAVEQGFGRAPVLIREGGSIPVVTTFRRLLGVDTLLLGWGQNTDNLHSPDEHFSVCDFHAGIRASAALWPELADVPRAA